MFSVHTPSGSNVLWPFLDTLKPLKDISDQFSCSPHAPLHSDMEGWCFFLKQSELLIQKNPSDQNLENRLGILTSAIKLYLQIAMTLYFVFVGGFSLFLSSKNITSMVPVVPGVMITQ